MGAARRTSSGVARMTEVSRLPALKAMARQGHQRAERRDGVGLKAGQRDEFVG